MLDYSSLFALAAVVKEGSFERAARALHVTPSAVSQRIRLLEERLGCALVVRGQPCQATEAGRRLCQHIDRVSLLEHELCLITQTSGNGAWPTRIELVPNHSVRVEEAAGGRRFFVDGERHELWPVGDLWHVPAYTVPGQFLGLSPIAYHRTTIGNGLAAEQFSADFFADGGHPSAILAPSTDPGPEAARAIKERFLAMTRGNRDLVVVPQDTKYIPIQVSPQDSQFIDTMRYSAEQICRIYGEDPADHGVSTSSSSITYANRVDADLARFKRRQFWVTKLQNALTDLLPRPQVVRLNTSATLMMTARERHELHRLRLESRTTTINEVRRIEDEQPFGPEFNEPGIPPFGTPPVQSA